jgi:predicted lipoprotein
LAWQILEGNQSGPKIDYYMHENMVYFGDRKLLAQFWSLLVQKKNVMTSVVSVWNVEIPLAGLMLLV